MKTSRENVLVKKQIIYRARFFGREAVTKRLFGHGVSKTVRPLCAEGCSNPLRFHFDLCDCTTCVVIVIAPEWLNPARGKFEILRRKYCSSIYIIDVIFCFFDLASLKYHQHNSIRLLYEFKRTFFELYNFAELRHGESANIPLKRCST